MKLFHIVGARPQFIKLAPLCRAIEKYSHSNCSCDLIESVIVHTGQHYDFLMSKVFFEDLEISEPDYNLEVGSGRHGQQTGLMLSRIEEVLEEIKPDIVIVYGDTNSTLAGALAASKLHIPIAHIESGLRSYNHRMPEEINRLLTDHISSILFCPTKTAVKNLKKEGFTHITKKGELIDSIDEISFPDDHSPIVINVGDIMYDSILFSLLRAEEKSGILKILNLQTTNGDFIPYALCTIHRQENTDDPQKLEILLSVLDEISSNGMQIIFPMHPRTRKLFDSLKNYFSHIMIIDPISYYDMLILQKNAKIIFTDSGGVQKEAFFMGVPCVTLRRETEWVETVYAGMNIIAGINRERILHAYDKMYKHFSLVHRQKAICTCFGNGNSSELILKIILKYLAVS